MQPFETFGVAIAVIAFGIAASVSSRRRRARVGWWTWSWATLIAAGVGLQFGDDSIAPRAAGAFLAVLFPGLQLAGAFEYTGREVPRWVLPSALAVATFRLGVAAAGFEEESHLAVLPFELAALAAAAGLVLRPRSRSGELLPLDWLLVLGFGVIAIAEAGDAVLDIGGAGISWPVWLVIGIPFGSCQLLSTFDRLQRELSESLAEREEALRNVEDGNERFRAIAEEAYDIIVESAPGRGIQFANPRFYEVLGYAPDEVLGRRLQDFAWDADSFPSRRDIQEQRLRLYAPLRIRHADGSPRWIEASVRSYVWGDELRLVVIARDATERLKSEEATRRAQKLESLGLMAGGIAHDFNNLLTGILANADLARLQLAEGHPAHERIELAIDASQQAARLTQQLQAYSGASPFALRSIDVSEVLAARSQLIRTAVGDLVTLELDLEEGLPAVEADPGLLLQAVLNLAINGAEACAGGKGSVKISTGAVRIESDPPAPATGRLTSGSYVYVEVADTGPGISEAVQERMFDPFFTTNTTGRGLGLAVVHGVVRTLGGAMLVDSLLGAGARLRLLLPVSTGRRDDAAPSRRGDLEGSETLLAVDDNAAVLEVIRATLGSYGYEVLTAESGAEAARILADRSVDLVLLDAVMPGEPGQAVLEKLRVLRPGVPILLISGYAEEEAMRHFAESGDAAGFLAKPFTTEALAVAVRSALEGRAIDRSP